MNPPMAGLGGQSDEEAVTSPKRMADATNKKKREDPSNQTHVSKARPQFLYLYSDFCNTNTPFLYVYFQLR